MSLLIDSLRYFWIPGIQNVEADLNLTLGSWLKKANYYVQTVTSPSEFTIRFASLGEVAPIFAASSNRTISGCFESIVSIDEVKRSPRSVAWLLVKLYYSAFFAAHGHMRACGVSCANIDALDASRIYDSAKSYGVIGLTPKINSGQYLLKLDTNTLDLSFSSVTEKGSHEALWRTYKDFINQIAINLPNYIPIQQQRSQIVSQLTQLQNVLCLRGANGGNWLSQFRNSVQYRHSYGAWHPYSLDKSAPPKMISKIFSTFIQEPDIASLAVHGLKPDDDVDVFYRCTMFLSSIARATAIDLATRSTNNKSVARRGAVTFLKLCKFD